MNSDHVSMTPANDEKARLQMLFGAEGSAHLTLLSLTLVGVLCVCLLSIFALYKKIPEPKYFAMNTQNQFFNLTPLNEPGLSQGLLQNWVATFALASHTVDFYNFDNQVTNMKKYFTPTGYDEYVANISGFRDEVIQKQIMLSCIVTEAPSIRRSTVIDNIYEWYVEVPILIRYDSASAARNEKRTLTLVIRRYPNPENPYGVAVSMFRSKK